MKSKRSGKVDHYVMAESVKHAAEKVERMYLPGGGRFDREGKTKVIKVTYIVQTGQNRGKKIVYRKNAKGRWINES